MSNGKDITKDVIKIQKKLEKIAAKNEVSARRPRCQCHCAGLPLNYIN